MNPTDPTLTGLDQALFRLLLSPPTDFLAADTLAQHLGVTPAEVTGRIHLLQQLGLGLEYHPRLGWRWGDPGDFLWADEIQARLTPPTAPPRSWRLLCLEETSSTNDVALQAARRGEPGGLVVTANRQRAGRGRLGRRWSSDQPSGLYFSVLLRPEWPLAQLSRLTIVSGLAAAEAVENVTRHPVQLKWPNDLMGEGRKLGGILVEVLAQAGVIRAAVLGFGLNLHQLPEDFPPDLQARATSLRLLTGRRWRRAEILAALLQRLDVLLCEPPAAVQERWSARCLSLGQTLTVQASEGPRTGQALGLDADGCLLLRVDSGAIHRVQVGDVQTAPLFPEK